jgi:hypothetical protein
MLPHPPPPNPQTRTAPLPHMSEASSTCHLKNMLTAPQPAQQLGENSRLSTRRLWRTARPRASLSRYTYALTPRDGHGGRQGEVCSPECHPTRRCRSGWCPDQSPRCRCSVPSVNCLPVAEKHRTAAECLPSDGLRGRCGCFR